MHYWTTTVNPLHQESIMATCLIALTFESVHEILWCGPSNDTSSAVLSHGTIYLVCSSNFWICGWNPMVWPFKWNLFSSTDFHMVLSNMQQVVLVTFDKILQKLQLNWSLLRTFLWCFPFSIHKFSKLTLGLFKTEFRFQTLKLIRFNTSSNHRGGNCWTTVCLCLAVWDYYTGKQD